MLPSHPEESAYRARVARALGDGYELGQLLGRGGFAEVYQALDRRLKREVAVKVLRYDLAPTSTVLERFTREAEAVAQLRHPNILPIYSVGEGEGIAYFTMPLVRGETLRAALERETRLPVAEARRILLEAAGALQAAHAAGVVHRDIKPDNIMLEGEERRVLLMDFGIAKAVREGDAALTGTGMIIGTPQYMSPEQASGERAVDSRSDLYSLGVVGFHMLAGELPFTAPSVVALLMKHVVEEAPSLGARRHDCPPDLVAAIARCLAKDAAARWDSAAALRAALQEAPVGRPEGVVAAPLTPPATPGAEPVAAPGAPVRPVTRFRRTALVAVVATVLLAVLDLGTSAQADFAPLVGAVAAVVIAAAYGRLRFEGYGWRDLWKRAGEAGGGGGAAGRSGEHLLAVQRVHADRAAVLGMLERMSKAERSVLGDVMPAVDRLLAQATEQARQVDAVARKMEQIEPELRGEWSARLAAVQGHLDGTAEAMHAIRLGVRRVTSDGIAASAEAIQAALAQVPAEGVTP